MDSVSARKTGGAGEPKEGDLPLALDAVGYSGLVHYAHAKKWWMAWGFPVVPAKYLPRGVVIRWNGIPVAMGFIYGDATTPICWVEYIVADREAPKNVRGKALDMLLESLLDLGKRSGFDAFFTSSKNQALTARLKRHGWQIGDENTTQLLRRVN